MDPITIVSFIVYGVLMYMWGRGDSKKQITKNVMDEIVSRAAVPIGIVEEIEGHYYVYEKDTTKFLGQAATLEELPKKLLENKITIALLMYPEKSSDIYWCINGKLKAANES